MTKGGSMERLRRILPHGFLVFALSSTVLGFSGSFCLICLLFATLMFYRLPLPSATAAAAILRPDRVSIIAHKGGAIDAPENTLAAIRLAKQNGAEGVEFDVQYTADDVAVLLHDDTVDRTTDGTGAIQHMTFAQIQKLNAAAKHPLSSKFGTERIPSLEEAVDLLLELDLIIYFDVKGKAKRSADVLCNLYKKNPKLYKVAIVCSFYPQIIYLVRKQDPNIVTAQTWRPYIISRKSIENDYPDWRKDNWIQRGMDVMIDHAYKWALFSWAWFLCGNSAFLIHKDCVSVDMVQYWKNRGIQLITWTVNEEHEKEFLTKTAKVSYITDTMIR